MELKRGGYLILINSSSCRVDGTHEGNGKINSKCVDNAWYCVVWAGRSTFTFLIAWESNRAVKFEEKRGANLDLVRL